MWSKLELRSYRDITPTGIMSQSSQCHGFEYRDQETTFIRSIEKCKSKIVSRFREQHKGVWGLAG